MDVDCTLPAKRYNTARVVTPRFMRWACRAYSSRLRVPRRMLFKRPRCLTVHEAAALPSVRRARAGALLVLGSWVDARRRFHLFVIPHRVPHGFHPRSSYCFHQVALTAYFAVEQQASRPVRQYSRRVWDSRIWGPKYIPCQMGTREDGRARTHAHAHPPCFEFRIACVWTPHRMLFLSNRLDRFRQVGRGVTQAELHHCCRDDRARCTSTFVSAARDVESIDSPGWLCTRPSTQTAVCQFKIVNITGPY